MRRIAALALSSLMLTACAATPAVRARQDIPGPGARQADAVTAAFLIGLRTLDDPGWEIVNDQTNLGLELDWWQPSKGGLGYEIGLYRSSASEDNSKFDIQADGSIVEYGIGTRYTFETRTLNGYPYVGVGLSYLEGDLELDSDSPSSANDTAFGGYAHFGMRWRITGDTSFGFDYRRLIGISSFETDDGQDLNPDYHQLSILLGLSF